MACIGRDANIPLVHIGKRVVGLRWLRENKWVHKGKFLSIRFSGKAFPWLLAHSLALRTISSCTSSVGLQSLTDPSRLYPTGISLKNQKNFVPQPRFF